MNWSNPLTPEQLDVLDPILHRMAVRFCNCEADRLDYVQTAYLALFDGGRNYTNPVVCAYSAMLDYCRYLEKRTGKLESLDEEADEFLDQLSYEDPDTSEMEDFRSLKWLITGITEKQRLAAVWHWIDGLPQVEIASTLGVSPMTISNWLDDIKERVKKKFKGVEF